MLKVGTRNTTPVYGIAPDNGGYNLTCDGKPFVTPAGNRFQVPTLGLAEAIQSEWAAQGEKPKTETMPMTQLALTSIDIVAKGRDSVVAGLTEYIDCELLCHFAAEPKALVAQQHRDWTPVLDWCMAHYDITLVTGQGIMPVRQSVACRQNLVSAIAAYDNDRLTGLRQAVDLGSSLILGLALAEKVLSPQQVFDLAETEALFQMLKWGEDVAVASRQASVLSDLERCKKWFSLLN